MGDDLSAVPSRVPADGLFDPVSSSRISHSIVAQIKELLREGRLTAGDRLPSERELSGTFGVSRVTVREAFRVLEAGGLIEIRVGAKGGAYVTVPSAEQVGGGLTDLLSMSTLTASDVTEARRVIEVGIVPLVVQRATVEDIAALRTMVASHQRSFEHQEYTMAMSAEFHVRVAACAHNEAVDILIGSFHAPILRSMLEARALSPYMGSRGATEHDRFIDAVEARDTAAAIGIMTAHLDRTAAWVAHDGN